MWAEHCHDWIVVTNQYSFEPNCYQTFICSASLFRPIGFDYNPIVLRQHFHHKYRFITSIKLINRRLFFICPKCHDWIPVMCRLSSEPDCYLTFIRSAKLLRKSYCYENLIITDNGGSARDHYSVTSMLVRKSVRSVFKNSVATMIVLLRLCSLLDFQFSSGEKY